MRLITIWLLLAQYFCNLFSTFHFSSLLFLLFDSPHSVITTFLHHGHSETFFFSIGVGTSILDECLIFAFPHQCIPATESKGVPRKPL